MSEGGFERIVAISATPFLLLDSAFCVVFANNAAQDLFGGAEVLTGSPLAKLLREFQSASARTVLSRDGEYRGAFLWRGVGTVDIRITQASPGAYAAWIQAVSASSEPGSEEPSSEAETPLLLPLESAGLGAWRLDVRQNRLYWSERTRIIMGVSPTEDVSRDLFFQRLHPEDVTRARLAMQNAMAEEDGYYDCEFRIRWDDGSIHWVHSWGRPHHAPDGKPDYVEGVIADIDQRKAAVEQLERNSTTLQAIIDRSPLAVVATDANGHIITWNPGAEATLGFSRASMMGRALPFPLDLSCEVHDCKCRVLRADGRELEIVCAIAPLRGASHDTQGGGAVIMFSDATERKRLQRKVEQTQKLESLGVLAGGVAHDFNNLLTGILGNASLGMLSLDETSSLRPLFQDILNAGERAATLTRQLLAYAGKGRVVPTSLNLAVLLNQTASLMRASVQNERVTLLFELEPDIPTIEADSSQIQQVLLSLIMNGAEAIPEGERGTVSVSLRTEHLSSAVSQSWESGDPLPVGRYVVLEVTDTGTGMDESTLARIFEPFFSTKFTGRGLGLSAVLGMVRQHRGALGVHSKPGAGSTFRVLLPVDEDSSPVQVSQAPYKADLEGAGLVLVVDDEETVRNTVRRTLERWNYRVLMAENGQAAVEAFSDISNRLRAVVLDLTMPVMGGEEALEHFSRIKPDIPVILTSGYTEGEAVRRMKGKGIAAFLQKPFSGDELARKLKDVLRTRAAVSKDELTP